MDTEQAIQSTIRVLQRLSENPQAVLEVLDPPERDRVMADLSVLAERSARMEGEAYLLYVTDALHRLLRETPALAELLLPRKGEITSAQERPTTRKVSFKQDRDAYEKYETMRYARSRATEIRNHVVTVHRELQMLREPLEEE